MGLTLASGLLAAAKAPENTPYPGYEYNAYNESVIAPVGYMPVDKIESADMGLATPLSAPADFYRHTDGNIYLLDSGNGRVLVLDENYRYQREIAAFQDAQGTAYTITGAQGLTVDKQGRLYIADTENFRILVTDGQGLVQMVIERPDASLTGTDSPFRVTALSVNQQGHIYAVVESMNLGIFVFGEDGAFLRFFGSNPVSSNAQLFFNMIAKRFMTKEQIRGSLQSTPLTINGLYIDDKDFVYTVSAQPGSTLQTGMVRKLNYLGNNVLGTQKVFGDLEWDRQPSNSVHTVLSDIYVDEANNLYLIDQGRGRIFVYSEKGYQLAVFGGYGTQSGTFGNPVALYSRADRLYVLDSAKNCVQVFEETDYVRTLKEAMSSLDNNDPDASFALWQKAQALNSGSLYPYYGMGMVYDAKGEYRQAMACYRRAGAQAEYSRSFYEARKIFVQDNLLGIVIAAAAALVLVVTLAIIRKRRAATAGRPQRNLSENRFTLALYVLGHPADGFSQMKYRKQTVWWFSLLLLALWFVLKTAAFFGTAFTFQMARPSDYSPLGTLLGTVLLALLFIVSNWAWCSLLDGKGTILEVAAVVSYALIPYMASIGINMALSHVLSAEEGAFCTIITTFALIWSGFVLFVGLYAVHQYSVSKTFASILLTILGMAIIVFLCVLFYTLLQQAFSFLASVYQEAILHAQS